MPDRGKKIAYFIGGGIGDAILAYPAVHYLKMVFPFAHIEVIVLSSKKEIITYLFKDICVRSINTLFFSILFSRIFQKPYDISFTNITAVFKLRIEFAAYFSSGLSFGFRYPEEEESARLYDISLKFNESQHFAKQNMQLVLKYKSSSHTPNNALTFLHQYAAKDKQTKRVVIHPGSEINYQTKRWPAVHYKAIITRLIKKGYSICVLIGPGEYNLKDYFSGMEKVQILDTPKIQKIIEILSNSGLFIGNDSGPAHIAAFCGIPAITLFGPASPQTSAPLGEQNISIYTEVACSPCHFHNIPCQEILCMKSISVHHVWRTVLQKLGENEI